MSPASRQMSTSRVASATSVAPQALKNSFAAAERAGAEAQHRDLESRRAQLSVFHRVPLPDSPADPDAAVRSPPHLDERRTVSLTLCRYAGFVPAAPAAAPSRPSSSAARCGTRRVLALCTARAARGRRRAAPLPSPAALPAAPPRPGPLRPLPGRARRRRRPRRPPDAPRALPRSRAARPDSRWS